jgi:AcrR family transcriptional regulator
MPTAREALLDAAHAAVSARPWTRVRMVEVAARAGVSRQTLYNEFGSKEGLGTALVRRRVEDCLRGAATAVSRASRLGADPAACCAAGTTWMLRAAGREPLVRAALTGCWGTRMRLAAGALPGTPGELTARLRDGMVASLVPDGATADAAAMARAFEVGLRLALSHLVAPEGAGEGNGCRVDEVVRALLR